MLSFDRRAQSQATLQRVAAGRIPRSISFEVHRDSMPSSKRKQDYMTVFPHVNRIKGSHRVDPVVPQAYIVANYLESPDEYKNRSLVHPNDTVYPLYTPGDVQMIKGELCMAFKHILIRQTGALPSSYITSSANGLTRKQLEDLFVVGQVLWPGGSNGTGNNTASAMVFGPATILNSGPEAIPAGEGVILDDPECVKDGDMLKPRLTTPDLGGPATTKFIFTTRPYKQTASLSVFTTLLRGVMDVAASMGEPDEEHVKTYYEDFKDRTKELWKRGSIARSPTSQDRCPLRRYWLFLLGYFSTYQPADDAAQWWMGGDAEVSREFLNAYSGSRVVGTMTMVAPTFPDAKKRSFSDTSSMLHESPPEFLVHPGTRNDLSMVRLHSMQMIFLNEYLRMVRKRYLGVALQDIPSGACGPVLIGSKNFT